MPLKLSPTQIAFNARGDGNFKLPFQEQIDFFRQKLNLPTEHYDDILKAAHDRAFVVARAAKADLLNDLRNVVDKAIADGKTIDWFRKEFSAIVQKHGWEGWTGSDTQAGRDWRTKVIYKTNLSASYAAGRWAQLNDPDLLKSRPFWKYIHNDTVMHPRELHLAWSGMVLRHDDPWWNTHFPPNGWGCRCRVTAVTADEYKGEPAPDNGTYERVDRNGEVHVIPKGIDYGWDYAPGASLSTPLKAIFDQKISGFPAAIGADMWAAIKPALAMETALQWHDTLDEWLSTPQAGRVAIVGAIDRPILQWLDDNKLIQPKTAEIAIREGLIRGSKQERHSLAGDAFTEMEWRKLPAIIGEPEQVLFDTRTGKLIYVYPSDDDRHMKLAIEFDYKKTKGGPLNMIVSGFKQSATTIEEMIRGGLYESVE
jgi:hypothetical protein